VGDTVGVGVGVAGLEDVDGATLGAELGAELGETPPLIGATGAPVLSPFFDKVRNCKGRVDATRG
jgi:hypothetical protein